MSDDSNQFLTQPVGRKSLASTLCVFLLTLAAGCSTFQSKESAPVIEPEPESDISSAPVEEIEASSPRNEAPESSNAQVYPGTGEFINRRAATRPLSGDSAEGDITLNFEGQDLVEVARIILGDILQENYVIGPGVSGQVSFSTARPIKRDQLMPILEMLLRWNNATIVWSEGRFNILPIDDAIPGNLTPRVGPADAVRGFEVRAVPLKYIAPTEMEKLLDPFARAGAIVSADNARNLLMLAGTSLELSNYMRTIEVFDVNWLDGMSVGIFPLQQVEVETVITELDSVFGENAGTPLAGMFRFMPMERLNAILVITPQPAYLAEAENWVNRLDRAGEAGSGTRLYVYYVQNVKAVDLADYINDIFTGGGSGGGSNRNRETGGAGGLAPGLRATEISTINDPRQAREAAREERVAEQTARIAADGGVAIVESEDIRITAVEESNALLIRATAGQYEAILGAIKRLDLVPLQVLIEVKLVEVSLTGNLDYGVEWYFGSAMPPGNNPVDPGTVKGLAGDKIDEGYSITGAGGFQYSFVGTDATVLINALSQESNVNILSSPTLMVLNNKEANINVGDQIPVVSTQVSNISENSTSSVQFRDTGVILDVVPRVNPGGLVFMEISQELSEVAGPADQTGNVPISRRSITTEVAVQSGETVVLGGLISLTQRTGNQGVPGLRKIPILGNLFGSTSESADRTELLVMITPRVMTNSEEARQVTEEYQARFKALQPLRSTTGEVTRTLRETEEFEW